MGVNYVDSGEVTYLNNKFAEIYGWSKADFPNVIVFFNKVFPDPKKREILKARIMNDIASGDPDRMIWEDLEITTSKGDKRIVTAFNIPIFDQNLMISTVQDVTEKRKLEAHVQQTQRMEAIGTLAGGIAHDFNNMLSIIIGNISYVISICNKNSEFEDVLLEALGGAKRAQDLTQQLLTFAKGGEPIKKIHDVNKLVEEAAGFVTHGSKSKCVFKISKAQLMSEVDAGQINQVMSNLIINSDQAMPDGGIINLHTDIVRIEPGNSFEIAAGEYIKITIEDQGIGIEKRHIPKIFEPYFTTKQEGSGLGLATVYSIIKRHHGHITAYSEIGKGTVFHIYLPSSSKSSVESESNLALRHKGHGKILVLDDERPILKMIGRMLSNMGYATETVTDGAEAIQRYRETHESGEKFDLVILDLTVPGGLGGAGIIPELLKIDPNVRAVVSSGYSNDPIMANFQDYGFCGVVPKPYSQEQLSNLLNDVLNEASG